jgi:hypothetical protein
MIIDTIEAFKLLTHYGIRVARSKFVDSAEDAIAFAERRTAKDPRLVPIVLRPDETALHDENAIRQAYARRAQDGNGKILAQTATDPGTEIGIAGRTDDGQKLIALQTANHTIERMAPLDSAGAEVLALNLQDFQHRGSSEKKHRMLEHLLLRVSALFEETPVTAFRLTVRLHENSYTVLDASMTSPKALHLKERLGHHAHDDRKGEEYRSPAR